MSRRTTPDVSPTAVPLFLDYLLLVGGCGLSLLLLPLLPLHARARGGAGGMAEVVEALPALMRLVEGVILLWPLFLFVQVCRGRSEGPTAGEWLWVVAWLGVSALTALGLWEQSSAGLPEVLRGPLRQYPPRGLWYLIFVPSMGVVALLLLLLSSLGREVKPWTHSLGLALVLWPVFPLALVLGFGRFV